MWSGKNSKMTVLYPKNHKINQDKLNRNKNLKLSLNCQEKEEPSVKTSKPKLFLAALRKRYHRDIS
jgi:hypothetical protein